MTLTLNPQDDTDMAKVGLCVTDYQLTPSER